MRPAGPVSDARTGDSGSPGRPAGGRTRAAVARLAPRLVLLAALLTGLPRWLSTLDAKRDEIRAAWGRTPDEQVRSERGPDFADALETARAAIPPRGAYLLAANAYGPGAATAIALRLELLPRTAYLLAPGEAPVAGLPRVAAVVSVAGEGVAPVVSAREAEGAPRAEARSGPAGEAP